MTYTAKLPREIELTRHVVVGDTVRVLASEGLGTPECTAVVREIHKPHNSLVVYAMDEEFDINFEGEILL